MKIFAYRNNCGSYGGWGIECGIIIAESEDEAKNIAEFQEGGSEEIFEIPFHKGYTYIGSYNE